jgi:hypothetical protein
VPAENNPEPKKKEEDGANDAKQNTEKTNATTSTSTSTTTTATSSLLSPHDDEELNATKSKPKENNNDGGLNTKQTTTTTTSSSSTTTTSVSSAPFLPRQADTCCVCLEDLQVDASTFSRMTCCGKATHKHCTDNFFGSSLSQEQKSKCPQCQVKVATSDEEAFELARGWADKGKAWAQASLGAKYNLGSGVGQSFEKAI